MRSRNVDSWPVFFVITLVFCTASGFAAENLVPDPGFDDSSMPAWPASSSTFHSWSWDTEDIDNSATSGSGRLENLADATGFYTVNVVQCIDGFDETALYDFGVMISFPSGQATTATVEAYIQFVMYDDPGCTTTLTSEKSPKIGIGQPDTWLLSSVDNFPMAPGTESVRFVLSITKMSTDLPAAFFFDNAYIRPSPLFVDGFETGDTSAWSNWNPPVY